MQFWLYFGIVVIFVIGLGVFITFWKKFKCSHSEILWQFAYYTIFYWTCMYLSVGVRLGLVLQDSGVSTREKTGCKVCEYKAS